MPNIAQADPFIGQIQQDSDGSFSAPESIIKSVSAARTIYEKFRTDHLKRINLYKEIDGLLLGNAPYNQQELNNAGLQHVANFNDMSANAVFERYAQSYWNLLHSAEYLIDFVIRLPGVPEATEYANILAKNWTYVVKHKWRSFIVNLASLSAQLVKFGVSPVLFPDEKSPKWRVVELSKFLVPDQTQADMDLLGVVCVETEFSIQYLWQVYEDTVKKKYSTGDEGPEGSPTEDERYYPWNPDALGKFLWLRNKPTEKSATYDNLDLLDLEQKVLAGDISYDDAYGDTVRLISLFQKEYDGNISHYMFHRNDLEDGEGFLYFVHNQYKSIEEALIIFTMNPGSFTIHLNRGLGHKIFSLAQAKIMTSCSLVDNAKWASTPIIKSSSLSTKDADQIRFVPGVATNIGAAEFVQNNLGANLDNIIGAANYLSNQMQFNLTYSGSDPSQPDPDKGSLSTPQVTLNAFREFSILKNYIMHYQATLDHLFQNMVAKMLRSKPGYPDYELAELWKQRCLEDGVPEIVFEAFEQSMDTDDWDLPSILEVSATRTAGAGSQVALLMSLRELQPLVGSFGPREERAYKRLYISATLGPEYIDTFVQEGDDVDERAGGASLAGVENAIMQAGKSPVFSIDNEHRAHLAVHLALAESVVDQIQQQQMDVITADSIFRVLVPHIQDHLAAVERNPFMQSDFAKFEPLVADITQYAALNAKNAAEKNRAQIRQQQQDAEATQQVMSDAQRKDFQAAKDEARKDADMGAKLQRQEEASEAKEQALDERTRADIARENAKAASEIRTNSLKEGLKNTAQEDAQADPRTALRTMAGNTPTPTDIER